ncbi:MAG: hypothetical protein HYY51_00930 [Candidatus Magasanikbacteria bacterium]|nr:hypothetical protein [Candidatus Magasanikbacteria bacterium]
MRMHLKLLNTKIRQHAAGIVVSLFVALLAVAPHILFSFSLGPEYRGVHMFATPNEEAYIAIMQEILDGHPSTASMPFFEYKDKFPLLPATLAHLYTFPVKWFGISLISVLLFSKFLLPGLLCFAVYLLTFHILEADDSQKSKAGFYASAAALMVTLGFDLVDYRSVWAYLLGSASPEGFFIWTRPVNPVFGGILLFFFLLCVWNIYRGLREKRWIIVGGLSLSLMMASYVFSWTLALTILGLCFIGAFFKHQYKECRAYISIFVLGLLFSLPYWLRALEAAQDQWYPEAAARIGLYLTREPHLNLFVLAVTLLFAGISFILYFKKGILGSWTRWWSFSFFLILASWIVYNQQVITGREIWYYHYVFYTIPLMYVVVIVLFWHAVRLRFPRSALAAVGFMAIASLALGVFQQVSAYQKNEPIFRERQWYADVFAFFNTQAQKDCVVLINEEDISWWSNLIPAFTHCNTYHSGENQSVLADPEDFVYRYMSVLRLRGITKDSIHGYLATHKQEVEHALQFQLQHTLGLPDPKLQTRFERFADDYIRFMDTDFLEALSRFRIDYILSEGPLDKTVFASLSSLNLVFEEHEMAVFHLQKE